MAAIIVGGGIAGLSAAYDLAKAGVAHTLIEKQPRLGGVIETRQWEDCVMECGPDSFLSAKRIALTKREGQLVSLLSQGLKNKEIASMLLISEGTVKVYLSRLFQKVGVKDRFELALYGLKNLTTGHGTLEKAPVTTDRSSTSLPETMPLQELRALFLEKSSLRMSVPQPRLRNAS